MPDNNTLHYKRPESVLVLVYTRAGEVLMLERLQPAGFWQSVTGSLEWDETPPQAAQRELREETGLHGGADLRDCEQRNHFPILPAWRARYAPEVRRNTEHVFRIELPARVEIQLNPAEHRALCWLPRAEALALVSSHTNRDALACWVPDGQETLEKACRAPHIPY